MTAAPAPLHVLNGPNLNMLGMREPELYGRATLAEVQADCRRTAAELGRDLFFGQTNAEHELLGWVHDAVRSDALVVVNPAAWSFTSVALVDALRMLHRPVVEVHITNIHARHALYGPSRVSAVARAVIAGAGTRGYETAIRTAVDLDTRRA